MTIVAAALVGFGAPVLSQSSVKAAPSCTAVKPNDSIPAKTSNPFGHNEVPVLIVMGQSNAEGFEQFLPDSTRWNQALKNVYGIHRDQLQSKQAVVWTNYKINGFNLGDNRDVNESQKRGSYHLVGEFAQKWQQYKDTYPETKLPDLYIIHIAAAGQGFLYPNLTDNLWAPSSNRYYSVAMRIIPEGVNAIRKLGRSQI